MSGTGMAPPSDAQDRHTLPPRLIGLLAALSLGWGVNWPIMKVVVSEMEPMHFRTLCLGAGGLGLLAIARAGGVALAVPRDRWRRLAVIGLVNVAAWNICSIYGVRLMASGRASILAFTMPAWSVLLSAWLIGERLTARRIFGVSLAMTGAFLLLGDELQAVGRAPLGALLMLGAATTWAVGTVLIKRWPVDLPPSVFTGWQMLAAVVPIFVVAVTAEPGGFNPFALSLWPMLGILFNILIPFIFCYWAWMKIVLVVPVGVSSLAVMTVPVIGVFSGMLLLGERPQWHDYAALILVVASLSTVMIPPRAAQAAPHGPRGG